MSTIIKLRPKEATDDASDITLSDGSDRSADRVIGPADGSPTVNVGVQEIKPIQAANARFESTENRSGSYTFATSKKFSTPADAGRYLMTHGMKCPASGTLIFDFGDTEDTPAGKLAVLFGCVLRQIGALKQSGNLVSGSYAVAYGAADEVEADGLQDAIDAYYAGPAEPFVPEYYRMNVGGAKLGSWLAEYGMVAEGSTGTTVVTRPIGNVLHAPTAVYQSWRWASGKLTFTMPVPDGIYQLAFHCCALGDATIGTSVFNIIVNGETVGTGVDVYAMAGGKDKAMVISTNEIEVTGGTGLTIELVKTTGFVTICGIEAFNSNPLPESP